MQLLPGHQERSGNLDFILLMWILIVVVPCVVESQLHLVYRLYSNHFFSPLLISAQIEIHIQNNQNKVEFDFKTLESTIVNSKHSCNGKDTIFANSYLLWKTNYTACGKNRPASTAMSTENYTIVTNHSLHKALVSISGSH